MTSLRAVATLCCAGFLIASASRAHAGAEAERRAVEIKPLAVSLLKVKKLDPTASGPGLPEPALSVICAVRAPDGRIIQRLDEVVIGSAIDDTGAALPSLKGPVKSVLLSTDGTRSVSQTSRRSVKVMTTTKPRVLRRLILGEKERTEIEQLAAADLSESSGATTATLTIRLALPPSQAKSLKRLEGKAKLELAGVESFTFSDVASRVGETLDLGRTKGVTLEITSVDGGEIALKASGDTSRLGELEFFDNKGKRIEARSTSRSETSTDGVGQAEMEYDFGDVAGTIELKVSLIGPAESVEVPFAFQNIELP